MTFHETPLRGAFVLELERIEDERGFFARSFCQRAFAEHGLEPVIAQANVAFNRARGTLRGLHFQYPPASETKLVRCTRGAVLDVLVDLRPESPTWLQCFAVELTADNARGVYAPARFAHGYQVLADATETTYQMGAPYAPGTEGGLHHADPRLALRWPLPVTAISARDRAWPPLAEVEGELRRRLAPAGAGTR